jgi:HD-GYP domain-containing protein (c-di-GMP phosphodiesterase class II)
LLQKFERWDGRGVPGDAREEGLAPAIRLIHLAESVETFWQRGGVHAAATMARERRGGQFDPDLVDSFLADPGAVTDGLDSVQAWDQVIALDPALGEVLSEVELERALEAFADFADLKAPERTGHSRAVAALVDDAAREAGFDVPERTVVRRAALVHDLGRIGIPSTIWNQTTPWSAAQRERKQTYPYLTGRMLSRLPGLGEVSRCAAMHHERLDGSGYPNGLRRESLGRAARLLAAADVFHSLREERVRRPALDMAQAAAALRDEVRAGRLDAESVAAVLQAAGTRRRRRAALPGGLTEREAEVLVHLARGRSNREIAEALVVSQKTIGAHLEHIYTKLGVRTRTQAALYAMREGLAPGID